MGQRASRLASRSCLPVPLTTSEAHVTIVSMENTPPATRLPRYRRSSHPPPMQITARDIRIVRAVYEMRFLTREQIQVLEFTPSTASYCKRRLSLLFYHGFLDR